MKKTIVFCLVLLIINIFLFTACGSKNETEMTVSDSATSEISEASETVNEPETSAGDSLADSEPVIEEPYSIIENTNEYKAYMKEVSFPDWLDEVNNSTFVNSLFGFKGYAGQGKLVISLASGVESADVYINDYYIDLHEAESEKEYLVDFSNIARTGNNTIQVTNIKPVSLKDAVRVKILYPTVMVGDKAYNDPDADYSVEVDGVKGLLYADSGIDKRSFELIDRIVSSDVDYGFSAAQMAVIKDGRLVYANSWGNINSYNKDLSPIEDKTAVTNSTLFDLASNTKMYSANYAVQYLISEGKLKLSDRVCDIIGTDFVDKTIDIQYSGYKYYGLETNKKWKSGLTVENLLRHQAGFPASPKYEIKGVDQSRQRIDSSVENPLFSGMDGSIDTRSKTLEAICKTPLMYEPGTKTLYSDVDYMLLCFIVEEITGERFDVFLNDTFYNPLELSHITYRPLDNGFAKEDCAATELRGNSREGRVWFEGIRDYTVHGEVHDEMAYFAMGGISGHAGLFSNAEDLAILASAMSTGGIEDNRFFSENVIDTFITPQADNNANYGIGWWRNGDSERPWYFSSEAGTDGFGHQGWTGTLTVIDPTENVVIVYLTNKINTPLVDKNKSTSFFEGGAFTSGSLGFAPQLVFRGMNANTDLYEESLESLLEDMVSESIKLIPINGGKTKKDAAVRNAYSKMNVLLQYYLDNKAPDLKKRVESAMELFDAKRDEEALDYFRSFLE